MEKELMMQLQNINFSISVLKYELCYGGLDAETKKSVQSRIEALKDKKSSLNAYRLS